MNKIFNITIATLVVFSFSSMHAQKYKGMMDDYSVNFYDVVKEADAYFINHDKGKGSGFKGYHRWKAENEGKFYPSGDRYNVSHSFVENGWKNIKESQQMRASRASQNEWVDLGPYDANNVTSHYSQGIGRVETIFVDPNDSNKMYLGSRSGGFWRTINGGKTWVCSTDTMTATGVNTLSASVTHSDSVLVGLRNANNGYSQGIYFSTNGGLSWKLSNFNPQNLGWGGLGKTGRVNVIAISPFNSKLVFIGTDRGLYRSIDNLNTFQNVKSGNFTAIAFHPTNPLKLYVYDRNNPNRSKILVSSNMGSSFVTSSTIPGNNDNTNMRLSVSKSCSSCLFIASNNGVWKSTDEGLNYVFRSNPNTGAQGFAVSDIDTGKVIYGYVDLFASANGGDNFTQRTWWSTGNSNHTGTSYIHADLRTAISVNGVFYVGTDGYMAKSKDFGISWELLSDGTGVREFYRFGLSQTKALVSMAGSQDNGTSIRKDTNWIEWNGGDGMEAIVHTINENWMLGCWQYGNRQRTKNGGLTRHGAAHATGNDWIAPMFFDPNHQMRIYSFGSVVYKSETFGKNWQVLGQPNIGVIKHAAVAENNSKIMLVVRNGKMSLSTNGGLIFAAVTLPHNGSISDLAFDPNNDSTVIVTYDSYVANNRRIYVSHDLCKTWNNISFNLNNMPLRTLVIGHTKEKNIYVGGEIGVYYMPMGGTQWTIYSKKLPNVSVRELDIQLATNTLRAVTWGRGMFEIKLVDRENYASITSIEMNEVPTDDQPKEDLPIHVTAKVEYSGRLKQVYLMWSKDSASLRTKIRMGLAGANTYKTDTPIPNFPSGTEVYFKVIAESFNDTTESYKLNYSYRKCNSRPSVSASSSDTLVCRGEFYTLNGSGASTYEWDNNATNNVPLAASKTTRYKVTGWNADNCADSSFVNVQVDTVVVGVSSTSGTLEADAIAASYQWLDCDNNMNLISEANNKIYKKPEGGTFAVEVKQAGCVDTSACTSLMPNSVGNVVKNEFKIFPNPTDGDLLIEFEQENNNIQLKLFDLGGRLMIEKFVENGKQVEIDLSALENGTYILDVTSEEGKSTRRITKTGK